MTKAVHNTDGLNEWIELPRDTKAAELFMEWASGEAEMTLDFNYAGDLFKVFISDVPSIDLIQCVAYINANL